LETFLLVVEKPIHNIIIVYWKIIVEV
jgi:hypothetical protein